MHILLFIIDTKPCFQHLQYVQKKSYRYFILLSNSKVALIFFSKLWSLDHRKYYRNCSRNLNKWTPINRCRTMSFELFSRGLSILEGPRIFEAAWYSFVLVKFIFIKLIKSIVIQEIVQWYWLWKIDEKKRNYFEFESVFVLASV